MLACVRNPAEPRELPCHSLSHRISTKPLILTLIRSGPGKPNQRIRVQETVLLVNHALARGTPAIFVIFVVSRGSSSKALFYWLECRFVIFAIFVKTPLFLAGQKHGLPKAPFSGPRKKGRFMNFSQGHSGTKIQCESCLFS